MASSSKKPNACAVIVKHTQRIVSNKIIFTPLTFTLSQKLPEKDRNSIPITVKSGDEQWTFHCEDDTPLSTSLFKPMERLANEMGFPGRCILKYDSTKGQVILDRKKLPSDYGMYYDETVYLIGMSNVHSQCSL